MPASPKPPTDHTLALLAEAATSFTADPADTERASRGLITTHPTGVIEDRGRAVWDVSRHDFVRDSVESPDSVHPSLWHQARLNAIHGLFEVAPGLWQARGYDISNISFLAGDTGWVIIDPLTSEACARACLDLANAELGERPVRAVIYTHSHADHFGGVRGVVTDEAVARGDVRIIAPEHFLREAVFENVIAGPAMGRRATYQFGPLLPAGPRQHVDCGLGKAIPLAQAGLIAPTEEITETGQELVVDGIRIVFQLTPEAEAPAEMNFFFPDTGWLCMAENCSHNMHNLLPLRGAQARDSLGWSKYINEAIELFGASTDLMFASHHWPQWGRDDVDRFLRKQRDLYRWMHDQTMRRANHGLTPNEIAEDLALPAAFTDQIHTRGYYGALVHNAKASTSAISAGTTATRPDSGRDRRSGCGRADTSSWPVAPRRCCATCAFRRSTRATTGGWPKWSTTSCSPIRPTPRHSTCRPMHSNSSGIRPSPRRGATPTSPAHRNCATGRRPAERLQGSRLIVGAHRRHGVRRHRHPSQSEDVADQRVVTNWHFTDVDETVGAGAGEPGVAPRPRSPRRRRRGHGVADEGSARSTPRGRHHVRRRGRSR